MGFPRFVRGSSPHDGRAVCNLKLCSKMPPLQPAQECRPLVTKLLYPWRRRSGEWAIRSSVMRMARELGRGEYFAGLFILGCASAFASRIFHSVEELGWAVALFTTFEISVVIWISCISGVTSCSS